MVAELSSTQSPLQNLPQMLDRVEVGALAWPLHDRNVDSWVSEPALHKLRSVFGGIVLLEFVEQCTVSFPIRQEVLLQ